MTGLSPRLSDTEIRRLIKAADRGYREQPRRGPCLACGQDWADCPHSRAAVEEVLLDAHLSKRLTRYEGGVL